MVSYSAVAPISPGAKAPGYPRCKPRERGWKILDIDASTTAPFRVLPSIERAGRLWPPAQEMRVPQGDDGAPREMRPAGEKSEPGSS